MSEVQEDVQPQSCTSEDSGRGKGAKAGAKVSVASRLFTNFDSDRKYDPFTDKDPVIQDSKAGMETLLAMCNPVEISSLYGALGFVEPCPRRAKERQIMEHIRAGGRDVGKEFANVLRLFWEGLLYEYLRSVGCPLRDAELDPRHFVQRYWRRSMLEPSVRTGFVPFYLKREVKDRSGILLEDKDIRDIRAGLMAREEAVKAAETRVRLQHDYRFVLQYFCASRDLHGTLVANVEYLVNEVEQLRANADHSTESISIMEQQFVELENKYDQVVGGLVRRGAFQQTVEGTLYNMINESHATVRAAEGIARELLADMDLGPHGYEPRDVHKNDAVDDSDVVLEPVDRETGTAARCQGAKRGREDSDDTGSNGPEPTSGSPAERKSFVSARAYLGPCLIQIQNTHRRACAGYSKLTAELKAENQSLLEQIATARVLRSEAEAQAKSWEARHAELKKQFGDVQKQMAAELAKEKERASAERLCAQEATGALQGALDAALPTLTDMVCTFAEKDTEALGVRLFTSLGLGTDLYAHYVATKRMFEADLQSRAFALVEAERMRAADEAVTAAKDETAGAREKERGRPRSRARTAAGTPKKKAKGGSKSRSASGPAARGGKTSEGDKKAEKRARGKGKSKSSGDGESEANASTAAREGQGSGARGEEGSPRPSITRAKASRSRSRSPGKSGDGKGKGNGKSAKKRP